MPALGAERDYTLGMRNVRTDDEEPRMTDQKGTGVPKVEPEASASSSAWSGAKKIARIVIGTILIVLGLAALLTPLTPGSWLALVGLEVLGLRVLLRDRLRAWASARPDSKFRRTMCRVFRLDGLDAMKRKWRRRKSQPRP